VIAQSAAGQLQAASQRHVRAQRHESPHVQRSAVCAAQPQLALLQRQLVSVSVFFAMFVSLQVPARSIARFNLEDVAAIGALHRRHAQRLR